jgi:hypothetical protein
MTPDPYMASGGPSDPQSWNRYAYTRGDPVNRLDPRGLGDESTCTLTSSDFCITDTEGSGGDGDGDGSWGTQFGGAGGFLMYSPFAPQQGENLPPKGLLANQRALLGDVTAEVSDIVADPDCAKLFLGTGFDTPSNRSALANNVAGLADNGTIRVSTTLPPNTTATTAAWTTANYLESGLIYVDQGGSFFTGNFNNNSAFAGLTTNQGQELIIIHELLHYFGIVGPDTGNQSYTLPDGEVVTGSQGVSNAVRKDCF